MARKKASQRKVKMGEGSNNGSTPNDGNNSIAEQGMECQVNTNMTKVPSRSTTPSSLPGQPTMSFTSVTIKEEPNLDFDQQICSKKFQQNEPKLLKVKQEKASKRRTSPNMDLGSHLHMSLNAPQVSTNQSLTWSHLMEPKNFPRAYEGETSTSKKRVSASLSKPQEGHSKVPKSTSQVTSTISLPNRFSSSYTGNSGKVSGTGDLDLSKKGLPAGIRRILATKYGLPKRNEEGSSVVPNFAKSRSRFTVGPKKVSSDSEQMATDPHSNQDTSDHGFKQLDTALQQTEDIATKKIESVGDTRSSVRSSTPGTAAQGTKCDSENLESQGMLDLASHYGNLLKENTTAVQPRSASRSPQIEEPTVSPGPPAEAMIDLGSIGRFKDLRPVPLRRPGEAIMNLHAMETPKSPLSPSFRPATFGVFPTPPFRPNLSAQSYRSIKPKPTSTTFVPRIPFGSRSLSPDSRPAPGAMIDLATFGIGSDVPRGSEIPSIPGQVARRIMPKRRHSLDSNTLREVAKRTCIERKKVETPVKLESNVKLNISDVLKLEQVEQAYIKDLSLVQNKLANVRFKMQLMKQEMEAMQSSESDIKLQIDTIRAKRVRILKDAQEREGSPGTRGSDVTEKSFERTVETSPVEESELAERGGSFSRRSPSFLSSFRDNQMDDMLGGTERKERVEAVTDLEAEEKELMRGSERMLSRRIEIDRFGGYHYSNHPSNSRSYPPLPNHGSHKPKIPYESFHTRKRSRSGESDNIESDKVFHKRASEDIGAHSGVVDSGDGALMVTQLSLPRDQHVAKTGSVVEEVKSVDCNDTKQFLGCLEISSTTEESFVEDEEGPKEILAEEERESIVKSVSSDQGRISSTVSSLDKKVDAVQDSLEERKFIGHTDAVCAIIPFKNNLFSASADRTVKAFDLKTGECTDTFHGHQKGINCLRISSEIGDRNRLFTGSNDQTVRVYNTKSGTCTHKFSFRGRVMCLHIAFAKLFVGLSSGFVAVIDLKTNKYIDQYNCHEPSRISCLASASEGQRSLLCTGSFDSTITIRDQSCGLLLRTIKDHKLTVLCMQVVENILFSGSADTVVQSHNINTGQLVKSYTGHTMSVSGLQALGGVLITTSLDRIIRCFDIKSGDLLQLYGGNNDMIFSLAVFKDMIYTGCRDGKLSGIKLDLRKYHCCKWGNCGLKFGLLSHLKQHVQDHVNQTYVFDSCLWEACTYKFRRGKQLDVIQSAMEHVISHVPCTE